MHISHLLPIAGKVLVCGPNWLGDSIMCMPALQALRRRSPSCRITMLVKPQMGSLWKMHSAVDEVIEMGLAAMGTLQTVKVVKARTCEEALVFPNSFRSALVPYLARVPVRVGMVGHGRVWMLTNVIRAPVKLERRHQLWEYFEIAGLADNAGELEAPRLSVPESALSAARGRLGAAGLLRSASYAGQGGAWIGFVPGAARGPSKQWPPDHFAEAGRRLTATTPCRVIVLGTANEAELCRRVAEGIGKAAISVAGETSLAEFAAMLSLCRVVAANDSGGMHMATAVGARAVGIFGLTDPVKTGPIGPGHRAIGHNESGAHSRNIPRDSKEARDALRAIAPERVVAAVMGLLNG